MVTVHDTSMQRYVKEAEAAVASSHRFLTAGFSGLNTYSTFFNKFGLQRLSTLRPCRLCAGDLVSIILVLREIRSKSSKCF